MVIPLAIFYYIYLGLAAIFWFFTLVGIFHLVKYSRFNIVSNVVIIFYLFVTGSIFFISWGYTSEINWQDVIPIISSFDQGLSL